MRIRLPDYLLAEPANAVAALPREGTTGTALAIVMTIMSFLACLAVWAAISIAEATSAWTSGIANTITVQIKPSGEGPVPQAKVQAALAVIGAAPGIAGAKALTEKETSDLLKPWLGDVVLGPELPLPVLISVTLKNRRLVDFEALQRKLDKAAPGAMVDDHTRWTARLISVSRSLTAVSLAVLVLVLGAASAIIVFATRAGLMAHANIVEILHLSGAQGDFIAAEFERHFLRLALRAGAFGLVLAMATLAALYAASRQGSAPDMVSLVPHLAVSPLAILGIFVVPFGAALVATLTARLTVLRALETMP